MIRVRCEGRRITLDGHAGYGRKGSDIVCAAVSMLVYVQLRLLEKRGLAEHWDIHSGHVELAAREGGTLEVLELGLRELAKEYPRCVRIDGEELRMNS